MWLVVQNHQISVTHIEPGEVLTGVLGIEDVFVHHKGSSFSCGSITPNEDKLMKSLTVIITGVDLQSDLSDGSKLAKNVVHFFCGYFKREVPIMHATILYHV